MLNLFARATKSALSLLGESALLRGSEACQVNIERGVQLEGLESDTAREQYAVVHRDVATIDSGYNPKVGDTLAHPDGNFVLDVLLEDRGAFRRFVLRKA
jgi:hypothetical protein